MASNIINAVCHAGGGYAAVEVIIAGIKILVG